MGKKKSNLVDTLPTPPSTQLDESSSVNAQLSVDKSTVTNIETDDAKTVLASKSSLPPKNVKAPPQHDARWLSWGGRSGSSSPFESKPTSSAPNSIKLLHAAKTTTGPVTTYNFEKEIDHNVLELPSTSRIDDKAANPGASTTDNALKTQQENAGTNIDPKTAAPATGSYWFGPWWSGQGAPPIVQTPSDASITLPNTTIQQPTIGNSAQDSPRSQIKDIAKAAPKLAEEGQQVASSAPPQRGWFGLWPATEGIDTMKKDDKQNGMTKNDDATLVPSPDIHMATASSEETISTPKIEMHKDSSVGENVLSTELPKATSWGFWSRTSLSTPDPTNKSQVEETTIKEQENRTSTIETVKDSAPTTEQSEPSNAKSAKNRPSKNVSLKDKPTEDSKDSSRSIETKTEMPGEVHAAAQEPLKTTTSEISNTTNTIPDKPAAPHLLVPSFDSCFMLPPAHTLLGTITGSISRIFKNSKITSETHLQVTDAPKVKRAVVIGVHGFFPMKILQRVLGEPTGTSKRFAEQAAAAIKRWSEERGMRTHVDQIILEGEGRVADRVNMLFKILESSNHLETIRKSDFVLVACHSQGTPVGVQLVSRLIEYGYLDATRYCGIVGMGAINLGPFAELNLARILTGSAKELFDFSDSKSQASKKYIEAMRVILAHGVKLVFVASIDDQLVPLESATFANISHPFIFRAVFVDSAVHAPSFISHLVGFALKLRNRGVSDHGVLRELSAPLAGSLYSGQGHSRIYDDTAIYDLACRHTLETTTKPFLNTPLRVEPFEPPGTSNPYFLPWTLRGLLEDPYVRDNLASEAEELLNQFDRWKPTTKQLKDVKFRLEAIKSKL